MIKYLKTSKGTDLPICISYSALSAWSDETSSSLDSIGSDLSLKELEPMFYHSLVAGARIEGKPKIEYDRKSDEYLNIIDDVWFDFLKAMPSFFQDLTSIQSAK